MADSTTPNYGFTQPEDGASASTWGVKLNTNWGMVDTIIKAVSDVANAALPRAGGTMAGALVGAVGSAALPSITFAGDLNTGFYWAGADEIGVSVNGAKVGRFTLNGFVSDVSSLNEQTASTYTLVLTDAGKAVYANYTSGNMTLTVPSNASVPFPLGTEIDIFNHYNASSRNCVLTPDAAVIFEYQGTAPSAGANPRTLAAQSSVRIRKIATNTWRVFALSSGVT